MNKRKPLIILNVVLLIVVAGVFFAPRAVAQRAGRARGDYTMVAGKIQGGNASAIYIIDTSNQEMIAMRWNETVKALEGIGYRDLQEDSASIPGGR